MTMHDEHDELGAILAEIAMIAEDVNVIALVGSGEGCTYAEQMVCATEVTLRVGEMLRLCQLMAVLIDTPDFLSGGYGFESCSPRHILQRLRRRRRRVVR